MASIKISELEEVTELSNSDVLPIINNNETKKVSIEKLNEIFNENTVDLSDYYTKSETQQYVSSEISKSITSVLGAEY